MCEFIFGLEDIVADIRMFYVENFCYVLGFVWNNDLYMQARRSKTS